MQQACPSVCRQNTKTWFSQKLSNLESWSLLATYRKSYMGFSKNQLLDPLKTIRYLGFWRQNAKNEIFSKTKRFGAMVSIDDLQEIVHGLFKEPIIGPLKSEMAEILHLENRHDVIFFSIQKLSHLLYSVTVFFPPVLHTLITFVFLMLIFIP